MEPDPLSIAEAEDLLVDQPLVPALAGSIPEMKAMRDRCLAAGIPATVGCPPSDRSRGTGGGKG